jgi:hypothetical protein
MNLLTSSFVPISLNKTNSCVNELSTMHTMIPPMSPYAMPMSLPPRSLYRCATRVILRVESNYIAYVGPPA